MREDRPTGQHPLARTLRQLEAQEDLEAVDPAGEEPIELPARFAEGVEQRTFW